MEKDTKITSEQRESLVKHHMNLYCQYLLKQSSKDLLFMVKKQCLTVGDALLKDKEDGVIIT